MEEEKQLFHREVGMILDSAMEVHRVLGHGLLEKPYENALVHEFELREILFTQQPRYPVDYKGRRVGEFVPDLIAYGAIVIDIKTIDPISEIEIAQMLNYLRLIKHRRLETRRVIL